MSLTFRPNPVNADLLPPKQGAFDPYFSSDFDANEQLRVLTYDQGIFYLDGVELLSAPNVISIDLTFDQLGGVQVAYSVGDDVFLYWFDPQVGDYSSTLIAEGAEPKVYWTERNGEPTSQVIYSYRRGTNVYYRSQLDRYGIEYPVPMKGEVSDDVDFLAGAATSVDNTFVFKGRSVVSGEGRIKLVGTSRRFDFGAGMMSGVVSKIRPILPPP